MSEYVYVRLDPWAKTWHLTLNNWIALCGIQSRLSTDWQDIIYHMKSEHPQEPLCKRCIKCREARG